MFGRATASGKPVAQLLLREHATVTMCHSRTPDLGAVLRQADIVVVAAGRAGLVTGEMIKPGAVVVDVAGVTSSKAKGHAADCGSLRSCQTQLSWRMV